MWVIEEFTGKKWRWIRGNFELKRDADYWSVTRLKHREKCHKRVVKYGPVKK